MLTLTFLGEEFFNEETSKFQTVGDIVIELEHSLVSLSKWESTWEKPFLGNDEKTPEMTLSYIQDMALKPFDAAEVFSRLNNDHIKQVNDHIEAKMTATWFNESDSKGKPNRETITAELIYYWMISLNIPFECQYWHLNRLLTLIKVCSNKNAPEKKLSRAEIAARNRRLNAERKARFNTTG